MCPGRPKCPRMRAQSGQICRGDTDVPASGAECSLSCFGASAAEGAIHRRPELDVDQTKVRPIAEQPELVAQKEASGNDRSAETHLMDYTDYRT
jgi:hypothetical protein